MLRTLFVASLLALAPALVAAEGCNRGNHQAMSCAQGTVWDADSQSCVEQVSS